MTVNELVEWAQYAEKSGYRYILRSDHLCPITAEYMTDSIADSVPECWVTLGVLAATTKKIRFGPLVSPIGFRNPTLLAHVACTLHAFSQGRLILGVGTGWFEHEYNSFGYAFPNSHTRQEAIKIIRPLTEGKDVDFQGRYFSARAICLPKPKDKIHLVIRGTNKRVLQTAPEFADEWNTFNLQRDDLKKCKKFLEEGSNDRTVDVSLMGPFILAETKSKLSLKLIRLRPCPPNKRNLLKSFSIVETFFKDQVVTSARMYDRGTSSLQNGGAKFENLTLGADAHFTEFLASIAVVSQSEQKLTTPLSLKGRT